MGRDTNAGRAGRSGNSGRGGRGRGGRGRGASTTVPRKASEVGACKDLEGHIFTIGSGNKGKDGDMLRTSMEIMATYIVTKYGDFSVYGLVIKHKYHKNNKMFIP
jgi:hypothetical protein